MTRWFYYAYEEVISAFAMNITNNSLVTKLDHNYELLFYLFYGVL